MRTLKLTSHRTNELIEITDSVREVVSHSGVRNGLVQVYTPHTTAAITINENADPDVVTDLLAGLDRIAPLQNNYRHLEGNSAAHIKSSLVGASETVLLSDGIIQLGTWQGLYFCEFDGPRTRQVHIQVLGA